MLAATAGICNAQQYVIDRASVLYSVDLGSDLDISDPVNPANNALDCGDIYLNHPSFKLYPPTVSPIIQGLPQPALPPYKDDDQPSGPWMGHPFQPGGAPQPTPDLIGQSSVTDYRLYFDLDAEDQASFEEIGMIEPPLLPETLIEIPPLDRFQQALLGIYHMPSQVYMSFDDDGQNGWAVSGHIPTNTPPDHVYEVFADQLYLVPPPGGPVMNPWVDEHNLALSPRPDGFEGTRVNDDDVDALDLHPDVNPMDEEPDYVYMSRFWSPDHEANMGLNPGSIYLTQNVPGPNQWLAFDQQANIGLIDTGEQDADVDAFELLTIDPKTYQLIFDELPLDPSGAPIQANILVGIFSVDQDDLDTLGVDESGGLSPSTIYLTNLIGRFAAVSMPYDEDIDALSTIPEPAALLMLLGAMAMVVLVRRRR